MNVLGVFGDIELAEKYARKLSLPVSVAYCLCVRNLEVTEELGRLLISRQKNFAQLQKFILFEFGLEVSLVDLKNIFRDALGEEFTEFLRATRAMRREKNAEKRNLQNSSHSFTSRQAGETGQEASFEEVPQAVIVSAVGAESFRTPADFFEEFETESPALVEASDLSSEKVPQKVGPTGSVLSVSVGKSEEDCAISAQLDEDFPELPIEDF